MVSNPCRRRAILAARSKEVPLIDGTVNTIEEKPVNPLVCPQCGYEAKSKAGLEAHKRKSRDHKT